jgi:two-component system phosphate regulon response regulator PhoB
MPEKILLVDDDLDTLRLIGLMLARRLRAHPLTAEIPIIMLTAMGQAEDKVAGFKAGADAYLTKPTPPRELFAHVNAILTRTRKSRFANPKFIDHEQ